MARSREAMRRAKRAYMDRNIAKNESRDARAETPEKECRGCGLVRSSCDFYLDKTKKDGLGSTCRPCHLAASKARYSESPEVFHERHRRWRERNGARKKAMDRAYYKANKERHRERGHRYYVAHADEFKARAMAWIKANPERRREYEHRRRAALRAYAPLTFEQLRARLSMWGFRCWICGSPDAPEIDHVKPLSKGGAHLLCNLRPACKSCNSAKRDRWPFDPSEVIARG